ncbi:MFS transporter [Streptomyces amakusaensis]|uniref:MFS transporter n=1 Tax=Streptomyces amakusaensis TaxID=67271 RepID=A0ABW0AMX1_9ACTN
MPLTDHPTPSTTYRAILRSPYATRLLVGTLVGRLPAGMVPVAIVLVVTAESGPLALGGLLSAVYGLASALAQPAKGRLMDRFGPVRVSGPAAVLHSAGLLLLPWTVSTGEPAVVVGTVGIAGLCTPPLESGLRLLWPRVFPDPGRRKAALALDTGTQGVIHIAGPLLVAGLVTVQDPDAAFAAAAVLGLGGSALALTTLPARAWRPAIAGGAARPGPLRGRGLGPVFTAVAGIGFTLGTMNIWASALADHHDTPLTSGLMPAAFSTGSLIGGLIFGRRTWPGSPPAQLLATAAGFCAGWLPLLTAPSAAAATVLVIVPGLFLAPVLAGAFTTTRTLAPAARLGEAYGWLILSLGAGHAAGTALAGHLTATHPLAAPALLVAGAAAAVTAAAAARRHRTPAASSPPRP